MNTNLAMYYAQQSLEKYQPLIRDGLVCFDPLVMLHDTAQIGGQTLSYDEDVETMTIDGVKCIGRSGGDYAQNMIATTPENMPSGRQHFTYAVWTCNSTFPSGTRLIFTRGNFVTSGNPQRFSIHRNVSYDSRVLCDLKSGSNSKSYGGYALNGTWKHNLVSYNGIYFTWYVDGNLTWVAQGVTMNIPAASLLTMSAVGSTYNGYTRLYIFNRALDTSEIVKLSSENIRI